MNDPPYTNCWQGVAPETGSLRKFVASGSSQHFLTAGLAVSLTVKDGADPNDLETRWFAEGDCASCQHRSITRSTRLRRHDRRAEQQP